jgi:hypothetical protein
MSGLAVIDTLPPTPVPVAVMSPSIIPAPRPAMLSSLTNLQNFLLGLPSDVFLQTPLPTEHLLHGGMYARTVRRDFDSVTIGSLINKATILIVHGSCSILIGDRRVDLEGYNVLAGLPGRKSMSVAHGPVEMTMICPTSAKTVEEAENEICAEADQLVSRRDNNQNAISIVSQ